MSFDLSRVWEIVPSVLKVHPSALRQLGLLQDAQAEEAKETEQEVETQTETETETQSVVKGQFLSSSTSRRAIPAASMSQMKLVVSKTKDRTRSAEQMVCTSVQCYTTVAFLWCHDVCDN